MSRKESAPNDPSRLLKRKRREVKVDPKLGGQWNVPSLVANGRRGISFQCLKANGKKRKNFQFLEANGMRRRSFFCSSFHFPPQATYLGLHFFPLISWFYFTIVLSCYLCIPFFFPWPINYNHAFQCHRFPTHSLSIRFGRSLFFA